KEESFSSSFYKEVIDLTIDSSSKSDFPTIELDDLGINIMNIEDIRSIENTTDDETIPIKYPATSNEGVAYVFNIKPSDPIAPFNDIQYSMEGGGGSNKINCPYLNCCVKKVVRKCTGVKICEYTENELRNSSHCEVDENKDFFMINQPRRKNDNDPVIKFIGCSKWNPYEKHIFHILNKNQIDINLLEKLFQGKENIKNQILQTCKTVLSTSSRLQYC
ncbi:27788_t:CDS:2, partial [Racocetra persica]